jgi:hypothetical protein
VISYSISLGGLTFDQASTSYQVPNQPIVVGRTRRRSVATGPFVAGETELSSVADAARIQMVVRCYGGASNPQSLVDAVVTAIETASWDLAITWDGATRTWKARAADWSAPIGGDDQQLAHRRDLSITVPVDPYPS